MVSPLMFMDSEDSQRQENNKNVQAGTQTTKVQRGRKPSKNASSSLKKKVPQRGMGVEQLERLRLQERWKKMTDFNQLESLQLNTNYASQFPTFGVPMQLGAPSYHGGQSSVSMMGFEKNFGFRQNAMLYPYRNGGCGVQKVDESNIEHFSMPKLASSVSDPCDFCFKKKCLNEGFNGESEKFLKVSKGVEVIAVHRNGNSGVLMEYEFFPEKRDSCVAVVADAGTSPSLSPTSVDLSLKL